MTIQASDLYWFREKDGLILACVELPTENLSGGAEGSATQTSTGTVSEGGIGNHPLPRTEDADSPTRVTRENTAAGSRGRMCSSGSEPRLLNPTVEKEIEIERLWYDDEDESGRVCRRPEIESVTMDGRPVTIDGDLEAAIRENL